VVPLKSWILPTALSVVVAVLVTIWVIERRGRSAERREAEARELKLKGQIVAEQTSKANIVGDLVKALDQNALLAELVAKAQAASPGAKPVAVTHGSTGTIIAGGSAAPPGAPVPPISYPCPGGQGQTAQPPPSCLLAQGDPARIDVDVVDLETRAGNTLVVGTAQVWREGDPPALVLQGGFQAQAGSTAVRAEPPRPATWGFGGVAQCGSSGACLGGPLVAFPPLTLLGVRVEAQAGLLLGSQLAATAAIIVRP
jgi:hypothetical protein